MKTDIPEQLALLFVRRTHFEHIVQRVKSHANKQTRESSVYCQIKAVVFKAFCSTIKISVKKTSCYEKLTSKQLQAIEILTRIPGHKSV